MTTSSRSAFRVRDFRLLWLGETVSSLGDQFALVALPWLALLLMLIGGVYVDRFSPRRVMFASNLVRLFVVTLLGVVVLMEGVQMWMLYGFALVFGVADAFFFPAQNSITPSLVAEEQLPQANAVVQGTGQLVAFLGPAVAGLVISYLGTRGSQPNRLGVAWALLIDAFTFAFSVLTLLLMRGGTVAASKNETVVEAIRKGLRFVWDSATMRSAVLIVMAINLFIVGPFDVGVPMIAYTRLPQGATGYGTLMSALGGGALVGMVLAGVLPPLRPAWFGPIVMGVLALAGPGLAGLGFMHHIGPALAVTVVIGVATGYGNLMLVTWAQQRVPQELMGRVISLVGLGTMALIPVS